MMRELLRFESIVAALVAFGALACIIRFAIWAGSDSPEQKLDEEHPHPSNHWSGRCYVCGELVNPAVVTQLFSAGKPPKHFCPSCRPTFA